MRIQLISLLVFGTLSGCQTYLSNIPARDQKTTLLTLGAIQKDISPGASSAKVIETLGSPNIITTNDDGTETWVYDKVSIEQESARGLFTAASMSSTRTLLVYIRFDAAKRVHEIKYRQTSY